MAEFLGDLAVSAATVLAVWGLLLLHRSKTEAGGFLKAAGWLAVLVGIGGALCTAAYMFKYRGQGDFDHAYPMHMSMMKGMERLGAQPAAEGPPAEEHEAHH